MHYYDFNIADYRKDTVHLKPIEHYIYRTLIDWYFLDETPIPKNNRVVMRRLCLGSDDDEKALLNVLGDFFVERDDGFHHLKIDSIIENYQAQSKANQINGKKGGRPPKNNPNETENKPKQNPSVILNNPSESEINPNHKTITNNHKPITKAHTEVTQKDLAENPPSAEPTKTVRADLPDDLDVEPMPSETIAHGKPSTPTMAGGICVMLRANGAGPNEVSPSNPKFLKLIAAGATPDHFVTAFGKARDKGAAKPFAYMLGVVEGELREAAAMGENARASPSGLPLNKQERLESANAARVQSFLEKMNVQGA